MSVVYVLIGLPGSGKSFWRENFLKSNKARVCSSDDIIEQFCKAQGMTYDEGFSKFIDPANKLFQEKVEEGFKSGEDLIIDRTNMNPKSRKRFLDLANRFGYEKIAIVFKVSDSVLEERLRARSEIEGKSIPDYIIKNMTRSFVQPSTEEGFDEVR